MLMKYYDRQENNTYINLTLKSLSRMANTAWTIAQSSLTFGKQATACALILWLTTSFSAVGSNQLEIIFDNVEGVAVDQPRVTMEVYDPDPVHSYGPSFYNHWLLDTGAQGFLAAAMATADMKDAGYQTVNQFRELGIGGEVFFDVSEMYHFDFAGSDGQRITIPDVRLLSSDTANFGSFGGIVGMPAMVNRTTSLDLTAMVDTGNILPYMNVSFSQSPLPEGGDNRYTAPITLLDYPVTAGQINPGDALPTYSPLPFINLNARHHNHLVSNQSFVLDTGAQITMIDAALAYDKLGLSEDDALGYLELGGVGEDTIMAPLLAVDQLRLPTHQGIDIVFHDLELVVLDIADALALDEDSAFYGKIDGIFGSDMLTAGYLDGVLESLFGGEGEKGFLDAVHFDFLDSDNFEGTFVLDINPDYHIIIQPWTLIIQYPEGESKTEPGKGSHNYEIGQDAQVQALPDLGWELSHWLLDGENAGDDNPITVYCDGSGEPRILEAVFEKQTTASGIPHIWLEKHDLPTDGSKDHDRIGDSPFTVYEEWIAGTNPNDITDILRLTAPPEKSPDGFIVRWRSVADRTYTIERSQDLAGKPQFETVDTGIQGIDGISEYVDETADGSGPFCYRVMVEWKQPD